MSQTGCRCDRFCYIRGMGKHKEKLLASMEVAKDLLKNFIDIDDVISPAGQK